MSRIRLALILSCGLAAACGGTDPTDLPDSGPQPDAPIVVGVDGAVADADPTAPDADTTTPDADTTTPDGAVSATCGNGTLEPPEQCDDGNMDPLDGCSPTCVVEADCGAPVSPITIGVNTTGSTTGFANMEQGSCGGASSGEVIFQFTVFDATGMTATTDLPGTDYNTALYIRGACDVPGTQVGCNAAGMLGDTVSVTLAPGTYYVFVDGIAGATGNFELLLTLNPVLGLGDPCDPTGMLNTCGPGLTCLDTGGGPVCTDPSAACTMLAVPITPGTPATGTTLGAIDTYDGSCSDDGTAGEIIYTLDVGAPGLYPRELLATVTQTNFMADMFDTIISITTTCGDPTSALDCQDSPGAAAIESVSVTDPAAGTYYVVIDGYQGSAGDFQLDVLLRDILPVGVACDSTGVANRCETGLACADDGLGGFTCQDPTAAVCDAGTITTGTSTNTGTLTAGTSLLTPTCGGGGGGTPEDVWILDLASGGTLSATVTGAGVGSTVYLRGADSCSSAATLACDSGGTLAWTASIPAAGRYYVVVDGGSGMYTLNLTFGAFLPPGATCDPASTTDRCGTGEWCLGTTCTPVTFVTDTTPNAAFCDAQGPFTSDFVVNPASMTGGGDADTFEVTLAAPAVLAIDTSNGFGGCLGDTLVSVYDAAGMTCDELDMAPPMALVSDDDTGPGACSLVTTASLPAGTYYVKVTYGGGATGAYVLVVDLQ